MSRACLKITERFKQLFTSSRGSFDTSDFGKFSSDSSLSEENSTSPSAQNSSRPEAKNFKTDSKTKDFRQNFTSGLLVSFIALPLCIAISIASGFPVFSGIFTAIIGGLLVSQISGSFVTINGPAAGMIVVILDSVENLGKGDVLLGYKCTLAAIVCASLLQILLSFTKIPQAMRKFPESIIRGMMMAIGLIVALKQIFILLGYAAPKVGLIKLFSFLPDAVLGMQIETFLIGFSAILLIFFWEKISRKIKILKTIPVYLVAIIFFALTAVFFNISENRHYLTPDLAKPVASLFLSLPNSLREAFALPDFGKFSGFEFWIEVLSIFAVGSLETVLSAIALDKLDSKKRLTDLKKDVRAVGIGNFLCGMIGALPMIAEIVRSSANVKYGATNKWSNFSHGLCLLVMITVFSSVLKFIPLCVLAGMLIMIGFRLMNIKLFTKVCRRHKYNSIIMLSVIFFTLYIDLLAGIAAGMATYLLCEKVFFKRKKRISSYLF